MKILLVYAARLLRNAANVTERNKLAAWCDGGAARIFAEDMCTFSITREMIESMPYEPINTRLAPVGYPDWSENSVDWLAKPSNLASCGLAYELAYRTVNSYPWLSQVLVARLLGAETMWNNPKFFEYCVKECIRLWEPKAGFASVMMATKAISADVHPAVDPDWQ